MEFIGRSGELEHLEREYERDGGFVVIYGRRRVGKTALIKEFIGDKTAFYLLASAELDASSRVRFSRVIAETTGNPVVGRVTYPDWETLFGLIADYRPDEKKVVVIDEFPYLVKSNRMFPYVMQYVWDEILKDRNVMLILCGSAIGMMKKHTLSRESPLYGRRTSQIRLLPLTFTEVYGTGRRRDFAEAVEEYSVIGGVPKYLELFDPAKTLRRNIADVIISKNGFLYEEPEFLFGEDVSAPAGYFSIMKAIADGNHRIGRIGSALGADASSLAPYLATLSELGYVVKRTPITEKDPERSRKGLYFISDPFLRFWFRYVNPFRGEIELDNGGGVFDAMERDFGEKYVPEAYEDVCADIFLDMCRRGEIPFSPSRIGSFWENDLSGDTQIDVAATDMRHKTLFLGECKYREKPVDADVFFALKKKASGNRTISRAFDGFRVVYGIFSKSGFTPRLLDVSAETEDLFLIDGCGIARGGQQD